MTENPGKTAKNVAVKAAKEAVKAETAKSNQLVEFLEKLIEFAKSAGLRIETLVKAAMNAIKNAQPKNLTPERIRTEEFLNKQRDLERNAPIQDPGRADWYFIEQQLLQEDRDIDTGDAGGKF